MKQIAALGLAVVLVLSCCRPSPRRGLTRIAIAQYITHPALDETREGYMQEMQRLGFTEKNGYLLEYQNAGGELSTAKLIAARFASGEYALIFSIATPMSQAVKSAAEGKGIPIVFGAITDPVSAGLAQSMDKPGNNITGTSDRWPYEKQMELIRQVLPSARRVGVVFNPGEANSRYAVQETRRAAGAVGLELVEAPVSSPSDIIAAVDSVARRSDVLYVPADNTAMAGAAAIVRRAERYRLPVVAGDPGTFAAGCLVGLGVSYRDLGVQAAQITAKILRDKAKPGELPVVTSGRPKLMVNTAVARNLGINIPESVLRAADEVIK